MKSFWKGKSLEMTEIDIFYIKWGDDHESVNGAWQQSVFVELEAFLCPEIALQSVLQKANFKVLFALRLRANGDCEVAETHPKQRPWYTV